MDQKKELLNVVLKLFEEKGSDFKMDDVAKVMKISKKTIYKEYGNKEALLILVVEAIFRGIERQLQVVIHDEQYNVLEKLTHVLCTFPDAKEVDYHKAIMMKDDFPKPYKMFIRYIEDNWDMTRQLFSQSIEEGYIKNVDFEVFRLIVLGVTKQILDGEFEDKEMMLNKCINQVFEGLII